MINPILSKAKILMIDDEQANLALLECVLNKESCQCFKGIADSRQAIAAYQDFKPDLIILDLLMPELDGFGVLEQLKPIIASEPYLPILVLTGDASDAARTRALSNGAKDFLTKPLDLTETLIRINNLLETRFLYLEIKKQNSFLEEKVSQQLTDLSEREKKLSRAQAIAHLGDWERDIQTGEEIWSDEQFRIFGHCPQEIFPTFGLLLRSVHPQDRDAVILATSVALEGTKPYDLTYRIIRHDGTIRHIHSRAVVHWDSKGNASKMAGISLDITERIQQNEEHARLITAIEQTNELVSITDLDGVIIYANPAFERISGYSRQEVIGKNRRILKSGKHENSFYEQMWQTLKKGEVWHGRFIDKNKDGTEYDAETTISPVRDGAGQIFNYVVVTRDVTKQKILERQLRQVQKMEAIGQLAGGIAHDFNNILQGIFGNTSCAIINQNKNRPCLDELSEIQKSAETGAALTGQLLAFSRKQSVEPVILDLNIATQNTLNMITRLLGRQIELVFHPSEHLKNINADPVQMQQILMNLCVNARDAMPGGGRIIIETESLLIDQAYCQTHPWAEMGNYAMLSVSDNGTGMSAEIQDHIFEPFFTTKETGKGTGLGLATVYGIVKQHGGFLNVYSEIDKGTVFRIYLPTVEQSLVATEPKIVNSTHQAHETILIAEDNERLRSITANILKRAGYAVIAASNGAQAVSLLYSHLGKIDLVLMDIIMPGLDGIRAWRQMKEIKPSLRFLFTSGYSPSELRFQGLFEDGIPFVQKPFAPDSLLQAIKEILESHAIHA